MLQSANMKEAKIIPRYILPKLRAALKDTPAVLIHGPRQSGKSTLAQIIGEEKGYRYYTFDDLGVLSAAREDPIGFVADLPGKAILDEAQKAPELFSSLKMAIDRDRRPGRFILTGSANVLFVPKLADSLAGRMEIIPLFPLAQCELEDEKPLFLKSLFAGKIKKRQSERLGRELIERVLKGGYPEPLRRATWPRRRDWYRDYVNSLIQRDIRDLSRLSTFDVMPKLLALAAGQTARLQNLSDLSGPFEISRPTIRHYLNLLEKIFVLDFLQPWHSNQIKRLIKSPKLHLGDTGLAGALLGLTVDDVVENRALFGQLLETFVYNELKRQASWEEEPFSFYHFRDKDKYEVDLVIQHGLRSVGIEVKAAATVTEKDFRGIKRLRKLLGEKFAGGIVLYDGEHTLPFGDQLQAVPMNALWSNQ